MKTSTMEWANLKKKLEARFWVSRQLCKIWGVYGRVLVIVSIYYEWRADRNWKLHLKVAHSFYWA